MIETDRLILRPFREEDAADVFEYLEKPTVNCFACMKLNSPEEAQAAVKEKMAHGEYCFAIALKDTGKVIGEIEAHPESSQPDAAENYVKDTFSPCWMLNPAYQGKGYAFEAAHAFFDYLFREKGARRIYAFTEDYNLPSQHLCRKLGMRQEGLFREFVSFVNDADGNPIYENTYQYAILKKSGRKHNDRSNRKEKVHPQFCGQEGRTRKGGAPAPGRYARPQRHQRPALGVRRGG